MMRKANKEKKKLSVTKKDLYSEVEGNPLYNFSRMVYTEVYEFRIRKYLFENNKLSAKGFLFNNDVLTLPGIAKRTAKGELLIDPFLVELKNRFELSQNLFNAGNELLAFLVDVDDALYDKIKSSGNNKDVFNDVNVSTEVSKAYERMMKTLVNFDINNYILNNKELDKLSSYK